MEDQILELKTCIAIYQKKYSEIINLNIGLESKLHYLSEKLKVMETTIAQKDAKLEYLSNYEELFNKISNVESGTNKLMLLDERMKDLEGQSSHAMTVATSLSKMKDDIVNAIDGPKTKKRPAKPKKVVAKKVVANKPIKVEEEPPKPPEESSVSEDAGFF
jgi:predicted nuclease with TOPRIM domain